MVQGIGTNYHGVGESTKRLLTPEAVHIYELIRAYGRVCESVGKFMDSRFEENRKMSVDNDAQARLLLGMIVESMLKLEKGES